MKHIILVLLAAAGVLTGCNAVNAPPNNSNIPGPAAKAEYRKISAEEAHTMMSEFSGYVLLDVRTDGEYKERRINGAILIPDYEIKNRAENELTDKDRLILIYCRTGRRSAAAAREMVNMGYTNVYDFGGITDWPYDTVGD